MILYHFTAGPFLRGIAKHGLTVGMSRPTFGAEKAKSEFGSHRPRTRAVTVLNRRHWTSGDIA